MVIHHASKEWSDKKYSLKKSYEQLKYIHKAWDGNKSRKIEANDIYWHVHKNPKYKIKVDSRMCSDFILSDPIRES